MMPDLAGGRLISGERAIAREMLLGRALCTAGGFAAFGVEPGDTVALVLRNDFPFFEASYAAQLVGAYCVPVNWHGKAPEIGYVLRDSAAKVIVAHADLLPQIQPVLPDGVTLLVVPTPLEIAAAYNIAADQCRAPAGARTWDEWLAGCIPLANPGAGGLSSMIYTSGTTGHPKGVKRLNLDAQFLQLAALAAREVLVFEPDKPVRTVITGPLYHATPNFYGLYAVRDGALAILQQRFDAEELLQLIEEYRITHFHAVPTMFVRLLHLPEEVRKRYDVSSLVRVVHGAAPCPPHVKQAMLDWWGPVITEYYGATETGFVTSTLRKRPCASPSRSAVRLTVRRSRPMTRMAANFHLAGSARCMSGSRARPAPPITASRTHDATTSA